MLGDILVPIANNLLGYDMLIILVALGTLAYYMYIVRYSATVYRSIYTQGYLPDDVYDPDEVLPPTKADIKRRKHELRAMRETAEKYYNMFVTLTGIFPFLGIIGTVVALIPLVQTGMDGDMQANFFVALTSTLWGLVFAIIFRVLDGMLMPRMEQNNRGIDDYLERLDLRLEELKRVPPQEEPKRGTPPTEAPHEAQ